MLPHRIRILALPLVAALLWACGGEAGTPGPQPSPPDGAEFLLRIETEQAIPPVARFAWAAAAVVTLDRRVLTAGAVPAIFPGPLVGPIVERQLTAAGWTRIVESARASGLLQGQSQIGDLAPGGEMVRLRIQADGVLHDIVASNQAPGCFEPCQGPPGTREAFMGFVGRVMDPSWLEEDLGPEVPHVPQAYAIIVGAVPDNQGLPQPPIAWPFEAGFDAFGEPFADGSGFRCGTVTGEDAATFRDAIAGATQITPFRDPVDDALHGLTVRALLPGDGDPCAALV